MTYFAKSGDIDKIINKQYVKLIHKVITTTISNYLYDETINNQKFICLDEDIKCSEKYFISSFMSNSDKENLTQLFEDEILVKVLNTLNEENKQILFDFYIKDYSLLDLAKKYSSSVKAISNKK